MKEVDKKFVDNLLKLDQDMKVEIKNEPDTAEFEPTAKMLDTFTREVPEREFLFYSEGAFGVKEGFLPSGVTCILAAPGGCGKTYLLMQAAIAAACGGYWLNSKAKAPVKVLFLAAEEDQDELTRRAQIVARSMGLMEKPQLLELVQDNLRLFGRLGHNERLMDDKGEAREVFVKLKFFLENNPDIKLVILDPASDYMCREAELDSAAAKDWTKLVSQLTLIGGKPTILVSHHTRKENQTGGIFKTIDKDKIPDLTADSIRGSGGLVYSFRWALLLARREYEDGSEKVFIRVVKTNYTGKSGVLQFEPDKHHGGILKFAGVSEHIHNNETNSDILNIVPPPPSLTIHANHDPNEADQDYLDMWN